MENLALWQNRPPLVQPPALTESLAVLGSLYGARPFRRPQDRPGLQAHLWSQVPRASARRTPQRPAGPAGGAADHRAGLPDPGAAAAAAPAKALDRGREVQGARRSALHRGDASAQRGGV